MRRKISHGGHGEHGEGREIIPSPCSPWFKQADLAALGVIALFFGVFFWRGVTGQKFFLLFDPWAYSYPLREVAWGMIRQGSLPLWTPLLLSGYPLLSMAQLGLAYPLTWGYLFLPGYWAEQIYVLAPFLLAPALTYAYAREVGLSRLAALLAGLGFGYGGMMASSLANGMMPNAVMWLPLLLIAIERSRTRRLAPCLVWATLAYTMSVLTGIGQGFLFAGLLAVAYAAFLSLTTRRLRPLVVALGALLLAAGVSAFQILETLRAARRSIRGGLSYDVFAENSYSLAIALKSFLIPLIAVRSVYLESFAFVALPVAALALVGVSSLRRDLRVCFWLAVALLAGALILGGNTPLYAWVYRLPLINSFRSPARHSFELTFALSMLAAYGWDVVRARASRPPRESGLGLLGLLAGALVGAGWWRMTARIAEIGPGPELDRLAISYGWWKLVFAVLILAAIWRAGAAWVLAGAVALACFVEPFILMTRYWGNYELTAARLGAVSPVTRFLQQYPPEENRVYTRVYLFAEQRVARPRLDPTNLTARFGLQNAVGYEPLIGERYSRALGHAGVDAIIPRPGHEPDLTLLGRDSHVLDLLNVTRLASFSHLSPLPDVTVEKDGIVFHAIDFKTEIQIDRAATLAGVEAVGDTLAVVTTLANSTAVADGTPVARVRIHAADGRLFERELRAGIETAEWAYENPQVRPAMRHALAPIFDSQPPANRYWARLALPERARVKRVEMVKLLPQVTLTWWKATVFDSAARRSTPLAPFDPDRWEPVYDRDGALVLRNRRALPRAWLVAEAEAVSDAEALRRIRGESDHAFDPRRTVLLESAPPALPGGPVAPEASASVVTYEPNRLVIETSSRRPSVLVVSEIYYPGWVATVDGAEQQIYRADYLLRGVALAAGPHRVEMRYTAPGARAGAWISILTVLLLAILGRKRSRETGEKGRKTRI